VYPAFESSLEKREMAKTAAKISLHNKSDTDGGIALKPRGGGGGNKQALTTAATHAPAPMDLDTPAPKVGFLDGLKSAVGLGGGGSNGHVLIEKKSSLQPINQDDIDTEPDTRGEEEEEDDSTVEEARGQKPAASPAKKKAAAPVVAAAEPVAMDTSSPVAEEEKPQAGAAKEEKKKKPKKASTKGKSKSKKKTADTAAPAAASSEEPEKKAAGRDKPKGGKGLGKDNKLPAPKRHGKKGQPKKANIDAVLCGRALRGLARRGNVRRMSIGSVAEMKIQLKSFLELIARDAVLITSHAKRVTVTPDDVAYALKRNNLTLWGGGIKDAKRKPAKEGGDAVAAKKDAHATESITTTVVASADKAVHA
jgi:histone H3/H4